MAASVGLQAFLGSLGLFLGGRDLGRVSQLHVPGSVSEECVYLGLCLFDEFMCVYTCVCVLLLFLLLSSSL